MGDDGEDSTRRGFLAATTCSGLCLLAAGLARAQAAQDRETRPALPDFDALTYCCFRCDPQQCRLLAASLADDAAAKKELAKEWEARFGRSFSPDEVFCFGCKVPPERQGHAVSHCTVRRCVLERKLVSCAHCNELATCRKELWLDYPEFRARVLELRARLAG